MRSPYRHQKGRKRLHRPQQHALLAQASHTAYGPISSEIYHPVYYLRTISSRKIEPEQHARRICVVVVVNPFLERYAV